MSSYRWEDDDEDLVRRYQPRQHSGPGIASFVISMGVGALEFMLIILMGIMDEMGRGLMPHEERLLLALLVIPAVVFGLVGLALGIMGVSQKNRNPVFGIIGLIFNAMILMGGGCLFLGFLSEAGF